VSGVVFDGVTYTYPGSPPVLHDVSLAIRPGEVTCCIGQVGAGCSTLLLVAAGFAPRVVGGTISGTVRVLEQDPTSPSARTSLAGRVGLVFATPWTQLSGMAFTVREEAAFGPANLGRPRDRVWAAADRALARVGASHLAARDPATLSGGELQRVVIAAALAMEPDLLALDDPTAELDADGAALVWRIAGEEARAGRVVLVASADLEGVADHGDRVILLRQGRVVADGTPEDVLGGDVAWTDGAGSTAVSEIFHAARAGSPPYPLSVAAALKRLA
jgi:energy-coupling factor transporter ATP-binding protein EcfA2